MVGIMSIIIFLLLLIIGVPISFVIGIVAYFGIVMLPDVPEITVVQKMFSGLDSFILLAVPLFILAANLMNHGKISDKLINFSIAMVGHIRGGLAHANVVVSMFFAGISGSSQADTAGVGKVLIPSMVKESYGKETALAVTAASSTIGIIIPPSIPMVIYGSLAGASVGALFLAGFVPGILIGLGMMVLIYIFSLKHNYHKHERVTFVDFIKKFITTIPPILTPAIIIGGIVGGIVTPTEAAVLACIYAFILSKFVYRTLKWGEIPDILIDTLKLSSISLFALATASALGELLSYYNVSQNVAQFFANNLPYTPVFMLAVIALFLFLGTFMDAIPAMILFVPVVLPAAKQLGISEIHLGLVIVVCLAMGLITPPYGLCLLLASSIAEVPVVRSFVAVLPYLGVILLVLLLIAYFPHLIFAVPKMIKPGWF
ncbi:TRAP transporter, DctM subunit [Desulfotomaculum arcticum]|uniref:TRAP transporter, DctM subunit n=2 Tax=Desulfotruncus TaxID=2867377 RepID=A0A1I2YIL8_9FIRM|nr:TRAP transporter, DctM subunit [Desulfotomaculum arcticum] [Desulfotruncus arcticus DSM 17038]